MFFKTLLIVIFSIIVLLASAGLFWYQPKFATHGTETYKSSIKKDSEVYIRLQSKAKDVSEFATAKNYNADICFLVDMQLESGKNRFFVYDLKKDTILLAGLVAHGSCDNGLNFKPAFSNEVNKGCSSLGRFKVGEAYYGRFGKSYKLYGLDSSNSNAFKRSVVLHSFTCVPEEETYPLPICNSRGCPMVSPGFMSQLHPIIRAQTKPVLLWIFN